MHSWQNKQIFGLAKELKLTVDDLRDMAAETNKGLRSLSALNPSQAGELIYHLRKKAGKPARRHYRKKGIRLAKGHPEMRPDDRPWDYMANGGKWSQLDLVYDYMLKLGWKIWDFKRWIRNYFRVDSLAWTDTGKVIEGLKAIYKRQHDGEKIDL